jgi:hypothetical protein
MPCWRSSAKARAPPHRLNRSLAENSIGIIEHYMFRLHPV